MKRLICTLTAALALFFARHDEKPAIPEVGKPAPGIRLNDHTGRAAVVEPDAEAKEGNWTVLAFYPKASTPGCTKEVCSMRDSAEDLLGMGVTMYAISTDDVNDIAAFAEAQQLNFLLLSDPDGSAATKYGVLMADRPFARRVTFVLDEKGVVRSVDQNVDPNVEKHGADLAVLIKKLRGE